MGRMSKTRKSYRLAQRVKYEDTKPERVVQILVNEISNVGCLANSREIVEIQDADGKYWSINPDFQLYHRGLATKILVEVDGPYHDTPTQRKKTEWRDGLLVKAGYRVIHIDAELTKNKAYQTYLKDRLVLAINSPQKVVHADA